MFGSLYKGPTNSVFLTLQDVLLISFLTGSNNRTATVKEIDMTVTVFCLSQAFGRVTQIFVLDIVFA
jgi:hypothetical protein